MMEKSYIDTVRLLLESVPAIFENSPFAMKGGTAINLFAQSMPRLSVDIDAVYTDHRTPRSDALKAIATGLETTRGRLASLGIQADISATQQGDETKLFIQRDRVVVKVEVNHVFRGTVLPVECKRLIPEACDLFTTDVSAPLLATAELYGSKLVAALDRQHPRDLFDVHGLFQTSGLTADIVECFICYLAGHNRPIHEVLFSRDQDISLAFENEFVGMTRTPIELTTLLETRHRFRRELLEKVTANHRQFLLGLASGEPDWGLMKCLHLNQLPAIRWKIQNLAKLKKSNPRKFAQQADELRARFKA
jgi:predicted nucleotidyltransferase component of viral defense system